MSKRSPITTHVLDVSLGKPAAGISCKIEKQLAGQNWKELGAGITNSDGRIESWMQEPLLAGVYRVEFMTKPYFEKQNKKAFYPSVIVQFEVRETEEHYHVPLLLSPFGFSTYRGS